MVRPTVLVTALVLCLSLSLSTGVGEEFRAGAALVDVTPIEFPVTVNGGMTSRSASGVTTPIHARTVVLDDGEDRIAIVVVDSCMMSRGFLDEAKSLASEKTDIRPDRMLISATHTHTAPASMSCLGTDADPIYTPYLRLKLAEAIALAESRLEPAEVGFGSIDAPAYTALRRWVRRPDRIVNDPFGNPTVRANMHAGRNWDDVTGESGPEDPQLSLLSIRSTAGEPIALLANFSMHYFSGDQPVSSDYFGRYCDLLNQKIVGDVERDGPAFVAMMSHGCSGDIWRKDYTRKEPSAEEEFTIEAYAAGLAQLTLQAYDKIEYTRTPEVAMAESRLPMKYRVPDRQRLLWAQKIVQAMGDRLPTTQEEVYAREQLLLHQWQSTEVVVQAVRIGEIGIATTPTETYALTGLKIKYQSPLRHTMVLDLANGGDGYIPPPEQHVLGGYNTWPARSAGLEVQAEPRIVAAALQLLEEVADRPRKRYAQSRGPCVDAALALKPLAYWRLDEFGGTRAADASGQNRDGIYEQGIAFFLEGPDSKRMCQSGEINRAAHFAGGRLQARLSGLKDDYSVSLWFWNGMPVDARPTTGWLFSRGRIDGAVTRGEQLGIGGTSAGQGRLVFQVGKGEPLVGRTAIERWQWNHLVMVREGDTVSVYLNGEALPEIRATSPTPGGLEEFFAGGSVDNADNFEGRLDEVAVFPRALSVAEMRQLFSGTPPGGGGNE